MENQEFQLSATERILNLEEELAALRKSIPLIQSARVEINDLHDRWEHGERKAITNITFPHPFKSIPTVQVALSRIDAGDEQWISFDLLNPNRKSNPVTRVVVWCENVSQWGFDLVLLTWGSSHVWQTDVTWIAYAPIET